MCFGQADLSFLQYPLPSACKMSSNALVWATVRPLWRMTKRTFGRKSKQAELSSELHAFMDFAWLL